MVYKRRFVKRRPGYKRSFRRRRTFRSTRFNKKGQKIFMFKRFTNAFSPITVGSVADSMNQFNFSLADVPGYTEFTAMFQLYKINAVKFNIFPQLTENISLSTVNNANAAARLFTIIDTTNGTYSTIDDMRQNSTCKFTSIIRQHRRYIYKPKILDTSSYNISPWMSTQTPTANYYGIVIGIEAMGGTVITTMGFNIEATYYLSFKGTK